MSRETREDLHRNFLLGMCAQRPNARAWHDEPALRARLGLEDNHYDGPIPFKEVVRRLFSWKPLSVPKANLIPCKKADANWFYEIIDDTTGKKTSIPVRVSVTAEHELGIVRSDTGAHIATHGPKYKIHDYEQWLLRLQQTIIGDTLVIMGAGLPRRGAQAYVQVMLPEVAEDDKTGVKFMPFILGSTSLDGSLPTTFGGSTIWVQCDNTRDMALSEGVRAGLVYKAKHTSKSLDTNKIDDVRKALGLIHQTREAMIDELHVLSSIPVNKRQVQKVWDILIPIPDESDSARAYKIATNKQEVLNNTYWSDPMMGNQQGTALGVVQAVNTWQTHYATVRGMERFERNMSNAIAGKASEMDRVAVQAIAQVCNRPELVSAN